MKKEELFELGNYINDMECNVCNDKILKHKKCEDCNNITCKILTAMNNYTSDYHCMKCLSKNLDTFAFYYDESYFDNEISNSIVFSYGGSKYVIYLNDITFSITLPASGKGNYYSYLTSSVMHNNYMIKKYKKYLKNYDEKLDDNDYRDKYEIECLKNTINGFKKENKMLLRLINEAKK